MMFLLSVKCWLYTLLGTLAEVFPEHMISQSDRLVSIYVSVLKSEVLLTFSTCIFKVLLFLAK